jgi:hypothetical protein
MPDCFAGLLAMPDAVEHVTGNLYKAFNPVIYCRYGRDHGEVMTKDWFEIYDAVADWFETIFIDYPFCSLLTN